MLTIRPARFPQDLEPLSALDTSFETDTIYRIIRSALGFQLEEQPVHPPLTKTYSLDLNVPADGKQRTLMIVAELDGVVVGFAAAAEEKWNRRVAVQHLYVDHSARRAGVGTTLLAEVNRFAQSVNARCLWVETQNVNVPAVLFYLRSGFELCGLDTSLYDPKDVDPIEAALFFARAIPVPASL